jgi:hypothetical protein
MYPTRTYLVVAFSVKLWESGHARTSGGNRKYETLIQSQQLADRRRERQQSSRAGNHLWFREHVQ